MLISWLNFLLVLFHWYPFFILRLFASASGWRRVNANDLLIVMFDSDLATVKLLKRFSHFGLELLVKLASNAGRSEKQIDQNRILVSSRSELRIREVSFGHQHQSPGRFGIARLVRHPVSHTNSPQQCDQLGLAFLGDCELDVSHRLATGKSNRG